MEDTKPFLKERPKENNLATRQAYLVMKILNSLVDDPHFSEFFTSNLDNIITSLFDIFDPQAEGSFYHFTSVLESLLKARAGDVLDVIFALKQFEVHLFRFVHYLHHSAVAHALQLILQSTCRPPQRRRFVESLRQANFLTTSQKLIIHTDELISSLYTVSFLKLSSEFAIDPFARSLFLDSTRLKSFVTELSKV